MGRMSVATVSSPEFINIQGISPFVSKCDIKVFYLGQNRNGSDIPDKETAARMAQTLPGCPIVGYYSENQEDFRDHGEQVVIDGDGVKFKCLTVPYGFVAPDSKVWFKDFEDTDDFGNTTVRTYLMTEGYLWTEQYEEAKKVINEGRPQSMELDSDTMKGYWSTDNNRGLDFFIITDAIFSKLCILGEDVEPCFEGANVTAPDISSSFTLDEKFTNTLYSMMKELKELTFSLQDKGGNSMPTENENIEVQPIEENSAAVGEENAEVNAESIPAEPQAEEFEKNSEIEDKTGSENNAEIQNNTEEFEKKDNKENADGEDSNSESDDETDEDKEDKKPTKNSLEEKYSLLEEKFNELQDKFTVLKEENEKLLQFKANTEDKEKDALIQSFYMLSDEDKKEIVENKSNYTLDEIEKELSVICVRKKVNFNLEDQNNEVNQEEAPVTATFNVSGIGDEDLPAWLKAVEARRKVD